MRTAAHTNRQGKVRDRKAESTDTRSTGWEESAGMAFSGIKIT